MFHSRCLLINCSVDASDLVSRVEAALANGNSALAESLVLSALNQVRSSNGPNPSGATSQTGGGGLASSSFRSTSGSRLASGFALGLLLLARTHAALFNRPAVMDQLVSLLASSPRELGITLPPSAVPAIIARTRGLHVS